MREDLCLYGAKQKLLLYWGKKNSQIGSSGDGFCGPRSLEIQAMKQMKCMALENRWAWKNVMATTEGKSKSISMNKFIWLS